MEGSNDIVIAEMPSLSADELSCVYFTVYKQQQTHIMFVHDYSDNTQVKKLTTK